MSHINLSANSRRIIAFEMRLAQGVARDGQRAVKNEIESICQTGIRRRKGAWHWNCIKGRRRFDHYSPDSEEESMVETPLFRLHVTSSAFKEGEQIPRDHALDGDNLILMEDPDIPLPSWILPSWIHWVLYNIPPETTQIPKNFMNDGASGQGSTLGKTSFLNRRYSGPFPPFGTHRYYFKVYALDILLDIPPCQATKKRLEKAMAGHVAAFGELMGLYSRK